MAGVVQNIQVRLKNKPPQAAIAVKRQGDFAERVAQLHGVDGRAFGRGLDGRIIGGGADESPFLGHQLGQGAAHVPVDTLDQPRPGLANSVQQGVGNNIGRGE